MAIDEDALSKEFAALNDFFPDSDLILREGDSASWEITGILRIHANYMDDHEIHDEFELQINISPDYPLVIPVAEETGNRIPSEYHTYANGTLCLGAPLAVKRSFNKASTLAGFFKNCLVPYLYAFSIKEESGNLPFGELSHGGKGILEYYQDLFRCQDVKVILELILLLAEDNYRGHKKCPCRSGKRIRNCHGPIVLEIKQYQGRIEFQYDCVIIADDLRRNNTSSSRK